MKRKVLLTIFAANVLLFAAPAIAWAANESLKQKVLPLDCVFQEVNDGLGTLYYLTPEECGVVITPPSNNPTSTSTTGGQTYYRVSLLGRNPGQPLIVPTTTPTGLPWQPIVAVVQGDGTVRLVSQKSNGGDANLWSAIQNLAGKTPLAAINYRPTTKQIVIGTTAGLLVAVLAALALL